MRRDTPRNKVNIGARMKFGSGWSSSLTASWVDATERLITDLDGNEYQAELDPYTLINARLGRMLYKDSAELSLSVFNMFNDRHYEYPPGINLPDQSSEVIGRTISVTLNFKL
jgi:outer membrane receptor protein involved in Fe transport